MLPGYRFLEQAWAIGALLIAAGVIWIILGIVRWSRRRPVTSWIGRPAVGLVLGGVLVVGGLVLGALHELRPGQSAEIARASMPDELRQYKLVDTDGQPFADAALNQREDARQVGAFNVVLGTSFVTASPISGGGSLRRSARSASRRRSTTTTRRYRCTAPMTHPWLPFRACAACCFSRCACRTTRGTRAGSNIPLKRAFEVFVPNVCAIDMDTTGTWPFGRRLEDQVATRFLSVFLDMEAEFNGQKYNIETLQNQAALDTLPLEPKTPPNPLKNDKDFLPRFPYLADPWPSPAYVPSSR